MKAMRATSFEFRFRFWIIVAMILSAFAFYRIDPNGAATSIAHAFAPSIASDPVQRQHAGQIVYIVGSLAIFAGALLRTWATAYLHADVVHDLNLHTRKLVADGPYRHLRNPLYVGVWLMGLGIGVLASRLGLICLMLMLSLYLWRLIRREEHELIAAQGESYLRYYRAVPSVFPALHPRVPASGAKPRWAQAFVSELFIWTYGTAVLIYALTLDTLPTLTLGFAGLMTNAFAIFSSKRGKKEAAAT